MIVVGYEPGLLQTNCPKKSSASSSFAQVEIKNSPMPRKKEPGIGIDGMCGDALRHFPESPAL